MIAYGDVLVVIGWREFSYVEEDSVRNHAVPLIALGYRAISTFPFPTNSGGVLVEIQLHTVTPIWTGGVERQQMTRIQESSIIGSLRWWYEVIVRGLGGHACDPTQHQCPRGDGSYCDVCQIFGATGWRRRFRLEVLEESKRFIFGGSSVFIPSGRTHTDKKGRERKGGWFLLPGKMGTFKLRIDGDEKTLGVLASLLLFLEKWGSLGAKPQLGYGLFKIDEESRPRVNRLAEAYQWQARGTGSVRNDLPDLRQFGFFCYQFEPAKDEKGDWWKKASGMKGKQNEVDCLIKQYNLAPISPDMRNQWRFFNWDRAWGDERLFFGKVQRNHNVRSKVAVSWAYRRGSAWEIRGYADLRRLQQPDQVWKMLRDTGIWEDVTGTPGTLKTFPMGDWQEPHSIEDVIQFLGGAPCWSMP